jgi:hypothetical protein
MAPILADAPRLHPDESTLLQAVMREPLGPEIFNHLDSPTSHSVASGLPKGGVLQNAEMTWDSPFSGRLTTAGQGGGVIVIRRAYWPGFSAQQNGRALSVFRSAGVFVAVDVPALGEPVHIQYRAPTLSFGLTLSGLALALWVGGALFGLGRMGQRRRNERGDSPSQAKAKKTSET